MTTERIDLYYLSWCGYCRAARRLLDSEGIAYRFFDITNDRAAANEVKARTGHRTMPVVLLDGELVGGYTELSNLILNQGPDRLT